MPKWLLDLFGVGSKVYPKEANNERTPLVPKTTPPQSQAEINKEIEQVENDLKQVKSKFKKVLKKEYEIQRKANPKADNITLPDKRFDILTLSVQGKIAKERKTLFTTKIDGSNLTDKTSVQIKELTYKYHTLFTKSLLLKIATKELINEDDLKKVNFLIKRRNWVVETLCNKTPHCRSEETIASKTLPNKEKIKAENIRKASNLLRIKLKAELDIIHDNNVLLPMGVVPERFKEKYRSEAILELAKKIPGAKVAQPLPKPHSSAASLSPSAEDDDVLNVEISALEDNNMEQTFDESHSASPAPLLHAVPPLQVSRKEVNSIGSFIINQLQQNMQEAVNGKVTIENVTYEAVNGQFLINKKTLVEALDLASFYCENPRVKQDFSEASAKVRASTFDLIPCDSMDGQCFRFLFNSNIIEYEDVENTKFKDAFEYNKRRFNEENLCRLIYHISNNKLDELKLSRKELDDILYFGLPTTAPLPTNANPASTSASSNAKPKDYQSKDFVEAFKKYNDSMLKLQVASAGGQTQTTGKTPNISSRQKELAEFMFKFVEKANENTKAGLTGKEVHQSVIEQSKKLNINGVKFAGDHFQPINEGFYQDALFGVSVFAKSYNRKKTLIPEAETLEQEIKSIRNAINSLEGKLYYEINSQRQEEIEAQIDELSLLKKQLKLKCYYKLHFKDSGLQIVNEKYENYVQALAKDYRLTPKKLKEFHDNEIKVSNDTGTNLATFLKAVGALKSTMEEIKADAALNDLERRQIQEVANFFSDDSIKGREYLRCDIPFRKFFKDLDKKNSQEKLAKIIGNDADRKLLIRLIEMKKQHLKNLAKTIDPSSSQAKKLKSFDELIEAINKRDPAEVEVKAKNLFTEENKELQVYDALARTHAKNLRNADRAIIVKTTVSVGLTVVAMAAVAAGSVSKIINVVKLFGWEGPVVPPIVDPDIDVNINKPTTLGSMEPAASQTALSKVEEAVSKVLDKVKDSLHITR